MSRNISLDLLKLSLSVMVVGLHTQFLVDQSPAMSYLLVNGLFRCAVPIFLIINGYYFVDAILGGKAKPWIIKIAQLYVFWMLFYAVFWVPEAGSMPKIIFRAVVGYWQLWYLMCILLAAPLVVYLFKKSDATLTWIFVLLFSAGVILQYCRSYHLIDSPRLASWIDHNEVHRNFLFEGVPFMLFGVLAKRRNLVEHLSTSLIVTVIVLGLALLYCEAAWNFKHLAPNESGMNNLGSLVVLCPAIFLISQKIHIKSDANFLSKYASGVFFIHPLFILTLQHAGIIHETALTITVLTCSLLLAPILVFGSRRLAFIL